jgi:phosphatidylserine/phosphatidylglycerophosphate/cardiolipin synthase-like enzyme
MNTSRTVFKRHDRAKEEVRRLLVGVFATELLKPSRELWIVSPWISNVTIFDNGAGEYTALEPSWTHREIRLLDCLQALLSRGTAVKVKTGTDPRNRPLLADLARRARDVGAEARLDTRHSTVLHTKGLLTDRCLIRGSMNLTIRGVEFNEEAVTYDVDPEERAAMGIAFADQW